MHIIAIVLSAGLIGLLGLAHLVLTYRGPKLLPRDGATRTAMERTELVITTQTTVWKAWIGFNASHSLGAILFAVVYGCLALQHPWVLFESVVLLGLGLAVLVSYLAMALAYWFVTPRIGIGLALVCYVLGIVLSRY